MSIRVMSRVWDHSQAEGNRLLVLLALADFADDEGYCWPKVEPLAHKARIGVRTVQSALADLEALGELERSGRGGRGRSCTFRVVCGQNGAASAPFDERRRGGGRAKGCCVCTVCLHKECEPGTLCSWKGCRLAHRKGASWCTKGCRLQHPYREPSGTVRGTVKCHDYTS